MTGGEAAAAATREPRRARRRVAAAAAAAGGGRGRASAEELGVSTRRARFEIRQLEEMLEGMDSNTDAIKEYREREREYKVKLADFDGVTAARDAKRSEYETLRSVSTSS